MSSSSSLITLADLIANQVIGGQGIASVQASLLGGNRTFQPTADQLQAQFIALAAQVTAATINPVSNTLVSRDSTGSASFTTVVATHISGSGNGNLVIRLGTGSGYNDPTVLANPSINIASVVGSDVGGYITLTTGPYNGLFAFDICHVDFNSAFAHKPVVVISPGNLTTSRLFTAGSGYPYIMPYQDPELIASSFVFAPSEVTGAGFLMLSNEAPLQANTVYKWNYVVIQPMTVV